MGNNILEIQNLTKYYGKIKGVENLSLSLKEEKSKGKQYFIQHMF